MDKKYTINDDKQNGVAEPAVASDSLVMMKEQAIESIRHLDNEAAIKSVLDFLKQKEEEVAYKRHDLERSISFDEFREGCYKRLKEMYGKV